MRAAIRIILCLAAWLTLSPFAMAACATLPNDAPKACRLAPCCEPGGTCDMPDMHGKPLSVPCARCEPTAPPIALPATTPDAAPPLLMSFEPRMIFAIVAAVHEEALPILFHPPPPTLLSLGTMLTC